MRLQYALAREDLTGLIESLRKLPKNHRTKLIIMEYSRLGKWIDWQVTKHGAPLAIVDPRGTSSECSQCDSKLEENGYRRLRCPRCSFEAGGYRWKAQYKEEGFKNPRDVWGVLPPSQPPNDGCKLE